MAEAKGEIEWHRMGARWWLESAAKIAIWWAIAWVIVAMVGEHQPRWAMYGTIMLILLIGIPLIPEVPREGEVNERASLKDSILGSGVIVLALLALAFILLFLFAFVFVLPTFLEPVFQPIFGFIAANKIAVLLFMIFVALVAIYERMGKRA